MSEESTARDERAMTGWHLLAFLGELVLWGCAAYAGWVLADGGLRWVVTVAFLVAIITVWAIFAAPRAARRLSTGPRLAFIAGLGIAVAALLAVAGSWTAVIVALASTIAVVVAQWFDARRG